MVRTVFITILLFLCLAVSVRGQSGYSGFQIQVSDSISMARLPGAQLTIISGLDTSNTATNERGEVNYRRVFRADSVELWVRHLGYKTKKVVLRVPREGQIQGVFVELVESAQEIAEIVVVGEAVAVVMQGDTVRFNAEAFKTFVNDPMSKLFEILPGMRFENGRLSYLGEPIHRVTIDGQRLFSDHVDLALENIRADDVVDVRVYKEIDDRDGLDEMENRRPITVADVRTRSKPTMIHRITLTAGGGSSLDPDHRADGRQGLYDASGKLVASRVGQTLSLGGSGSNIQRNPTNFGTVKGDLLYTREETSKYRLSTNNNATISKDTREEWTDREYFPTDDYGFRRYDSRNLSVERSKNYSSRNEFRYIFPNRTGIVGNANILYAGNVGDLFHTISQNLDGVALQSQQISQHHVQTPYRVSAELGYHNISVGRVRMAASANTNISNSEGNGDRIDTLSASTSQIYLENRSRGRSRTYGGRISAGMSLSPTVSLSLSDRLSYVNSRSRRTSVDMLTGTVDPVNSYDFLIHEVNNTVRAGMNYFDIRKSRGVSMAVANFFWEHKDMQRDERFPMVYQFPRNFNLLGGFALMEYRLGGFNTLKIEFKRLPKAISLTDYMGLDNSNPLLLRAGNLNLKKTASNSLSGKGTLVKGPAVYEFNAEFEMEENSIVSKAQYFPRETYLAQFDYTASAGSTLITSENRNGRRRLQVGVNHSVRSGKLYMNIRSGLLYGYQRIPAYVNEVPVLINAYRYLGTFALVGNFSSRFVPTVDVHTDYHDRSTVGVQHRWLEQKLGVNLRAMLSQSVELNSSNNFLWNVRWPEFPGMERFGIVSNLSLGYLFDDRGDFRLKVQVDDLLNRRQRVHINVEDEYVSQSYNHFMGRSGMIRLEYRF